MYSCYALSPETGISQTLGLAVSMWNPKFKNDEDSCDVSRLQVKLQLTKFSKIL